MHSFFGQKKEKHGNPDPPYPRPALLYLLTLALSPKKHQVVGCAKTGGELLELIENNSPDMILVQYPITDHACLEALVNIKLSNRKLPLVAFSADAANTQSKVPIGFDGYIPRPLDLEQLYGTIDKFLSKQAKP